MATIPIEVIVQDAEAPVVPSEDGTNTNITVPDTGTINSNGDTSSSASSIILPAILLVLAIGSIVAILIHKYRKQKKDTTSKKEKLAVATSSTIAILAVTVLIGNLVLPATKAATSDITDGITPAEDKVSIVVTRDGGVAEASVESTATITSTSDFGYKVLLSMAEGVETSNLYLGGDTTSKYYIASVEAESEEGVELADNAWGYALTEDGEYSAVPLLDDAATVAEGDEPVEDEVLSIYYGVKVSSDLPAGTYSGGEIEYNFVTLEPSNISELTYMQDFAKLSTDAKTSVLRSMTEDEQYTLKDSRDKKDYFIAKLADGNVWMTQNLDLDIEMKTEGSIVYDSTNTNLPANTTWEPERATIAKDDLSSDTWQDDDSHPYSYDPGEQYIYPFITNYNDTKYASLEACRAVHPDCSVHNHVGNYYNWSAAVASNDTLGLEVESGNIPSSICPAGWRLPNVIISNGVVIESEWGNLLVAGGIIPNTMDGVYTADGFDGIREAPLSLMRSGRISDGSLSNVGDFGSYLSSTFYDGSSIYMLYFRSSSIYPDAHSSRGAGYSVRCVAE